jgi:Tol biopolymer transport system component
MSASIAEVAALRQLARVYRRILGLAVPAALAGCQGAADSLAPDATAAGDRSPATAESVTAEAMPASGAIAALATDRIVFSSLTADGSDIWTMAPAGGSPTRLTSYTGTERAPRWSWDRKRIAFVRVRNGLPDIFIMNADGTNKHWARSTTYSSSIVAPSWSPDGSHLLVQIGYQGLLVLAKLDLATGNLSLVAPAGLLAVAGASPVYDPTGTTIFYVDNTLKVIKRFTPGGAVTTVLSPGIWVEDLAPSPDGSKLAYDGGATSQSNEIFVLNLATKVVKRLTNNSVPDYTPSWSPDGTKLAFASLRSGKLQVYTMNSSTGGGVTKITSKPLGAYAPAWTR